MIKNNPEAQALQLIFDNLQTIVYGTDMDNTIVFANKVLKASYPFDIVGMKCWQVLSSFGAPCPYCKKAELLKRPVGEPIVWENYNHDLKAWLQMNDSLVKWPDGKTVHLINVTDISSVKQSEQKLKDYKADLEKLLVQKTESEQIMSSLIDNIQNGFVYQLEESADRGSMKFNYLSASVDRITGLPREHMLENYEMVLQYFHPADLKKILNSRFAGRAFTHEARCVRPDGVNIWLLISEKPRVNLAGTTIWDGIAIDITSQKNSELALVESQRLIQYNAERLKDVSNNMINSAIYRTYVNGAGLVALDYASSQWEQITGFSVEDSMRDLSAVFGQIHPDDREWAASCLTASTGSLDEAVHTFRYLKTGDETVYWLRLQSKGFVQDGRIYRDGLMTNITEQKNFEDALRAARDKAEESDMLKSTFLANMSHEIRTPMNAIVGFLNLLGGDEELPRDSQREYMRIVRNSADQLMNLIGDILDISKIDAGQMKIIPEHSNLYALMSDLHSAFSLNLGNESAKDVKLILDVPGGEEQVIYMLDGTRLKQVLGNLIGNALKFTEEGYVRFGYRIIDGGLGFFVEDTGIGISNDKIKDLGKPFHQVHDMRNAAKYGGTGIGLAISMNLVKLMGGDFRVKSEEGKGSLFEFILPMAEISRRNEETKQTVVLSDKKAAPGNGNITAKELDGLTLLVAEDTYTNFFYLKTILRHTGTALLHAWNGREALELLDGHPEVDMVFMDVKMPVMDGVEATREIKRRYPDKPVIAQTAYAMHDDRSKLLAEGFDDYISKPISRDSLFEIITKYIGPV